MQNAHIVGIFRCAYFVIFHANIVHLWNMLPDSTAYFCMADKIDNVRMCAEVKNCDIDGV